MRTHFTQLPSLEELQKILKTESDRQIVAEKQDVHYPDFTIFIELLEAANLPTDLFTQKLEKKDLANKELLEEAANLLDALAEKILQEGEDLKTHLDNVFDYLAETDTPEKADLIFVFGSKQPFRTEKAIELYDRGYAPLILISGGHASYEQPTDVPEAQKHAELAVSRGVSTKSIIVEDKSITIPDNVKTSLNLLENKNIPHNSIILVNSPFAQRRGWAHFQKFSKPNTKLIRCNARTTELTARDSWYKSEIGVKVILKEFFSMKASVLLNTA